MTKDKKIEFVIENWGKMEIVDMAIKLEVNPYTISQWATRLRKLGVVKLPRKKTQIDWENLRKKYANKNY